MASSSISAVGLGARAKTPMWRIRKEVVTLCQSHPLHRLFAVPPVHHVHHLLEVEAGDQQPRRVAVSGPPASRWIITSIWPKRPTSSTHWLLNTFIVTAVSTLISVAVGILAAYALARLRFRGVEMFGVAVFVTYLVPQALLFLPLINVINFIDDFIPIRDTYWSLILTYPTFLIPFVTWLLMGYFRTVPFEVEECAYIDGASRMRTLVTIVLPMALPGVACAVLFSFTLCWNEFLYTLVFIQDEIQKTLSVGVLTELVRGDIYFWGSLMAACLVGSIPVIVLYAFFMDYYVSGLTAGAIK